MTAKCELFKIFSNDIRMKIFKMLVKDRLCVTKIVEKLNVSQPTVTQHLKLMEHCGLVKSEKIGFWVHYSANIPGIKKCRKELAEFIDILDGAEDRSGGCCHQEKCVKGND